MTVALLAVLIVVLTGAAAYVVSSRAEPVYGAQTDILVQSDAFVSDTVATRDIETQLALLTSRAVLGPVARSTGAALEQLEESVSVEAVGGSEILRLTVAGSRRGGAMRLMETVLSVYRERSEAFFTGDGEGAEGAAGRGDAPGPRVSILTTPYALQDPLEPQPLRAAAAGALIGIFIAGAMLVVVARLRAG